MSRNPYGTDELDRLDPNLDQVADELERYATAEGGEPPLDLASRIHTAIDAEPDPSRSWRSSLGATLRTRRGPGRGLAMAAVLVVAVVGALAVADLVERARQGNVGTSPSPPVVVTPSPSPSDTPPPSAVPSPSPSAIPSPSPTTMPTAPSRTPQPSASEDDDGDTPEPSESDNSGPGGGGGGGGDNSGPGGGGDSSGPGGGGDSSGPGGGD